MLRHTSGCLRDAEQPVQRVLPDRASRSIDPGRGPAAGTPVLDRRDRSRQPVRLVRRKLFRFDTRAMLCPPVFGDGCVFVADPEREITAIDTESFEVRWSTRADSFWPFDCLGGVLVTQSLRRMATRALDSRTGQALWERQDVSVLRWRDGLLSIDATGCRIAVAAVRTGESTHERPVPTQPLLVSDDAVVLHPEPGRIVRFDPEQQAVVWAVGLPSALTVKPHGISQEQSLYCSYSAPYLLLQQQHSFGAIDVNAGTVVWHLVLPTGFRNQRLFQDQWIVWSLDEVRALAPATGHTLWRLPTK